MLSKHREVQVRIAAAGVLGGIGPSAKAAVPALIQVLTSDADADLRGNVAKALGNIGPEAKAAIPALIQVVTNDANSAKSINIWRAPIPNLFMQTYQNPNIRQVAVEALVKISDAARDAQRTDMIDPLSQAPQALRQRGFTNDAKRIQTDLDILRAIRPPWYQALLARIGRHPRIVAILAVYLILSFMCLALLWWSPQSLSRINGISFLSKKVKLPDWAFGIEASLAQVILVGFFRYHPRVLDAWVSQYIPTVRDQFGQIPTVAQRQVHVEVPVELDRKVVPALKSEQLNEVFSRKRTCILIQGEGGSGKTSLACQIAQWAIADASSIRPCNHLMLPVMIEQDLNLEVAKDTVVLNEVIRGQLKNLTGQDDAPDQELVLQLLKRKRLLLIVDGFSEMSGATRNKIRPLDPEFAANNLIVTSRLEESWTVLQRRRFTHSVFKGIV